MGFKVCWIAVIFFALGCVVMGVVTKQLCECEMVKDTGLEEGRAQCSHDREGDQASSVDVTAEIAQLQQGLSRSGQISYEGVYVFEVDPNPDGSGFVPRDGEFYGLYEYVSSVSDARFVIPLPEIPEEQDMEVVLPSRFKPLVLADLFY